MIFVPTKLSYSLFHHLSAGGTCLVHQLLAWFSMLCDLSTTEKAISFRNSSVS